MKQRIEDSIEELPYVFHRRGKFIRDFRKAWYTATKQAGCAGRVFHALRRSSIRDRIRSGVHERVAMSISGHKTRSVFDRYNITNVKDMRDALVKTEKYQDQRRTAGKTVVTFRQGQVTIVHPAEEDPEDV
jgi:integrase